MTAPSAPLPDPVAGGRYRRNADGSLTPLQQTAQPIGRTQASRDALAARTDATVPAAAERGPDDTDNQE